MTLAAAQAADPTTRESFTDDPVVGGRFVAQTANTESSFTYNPAAQNLTAVLDVDASPASYLSKPFPTLLTDGGDASFSARFRVQAVDDQNHPTAFVGLMTDRHVGDFGDGITLVLSQANGVLVAHANIESFDANYSGGGVPLDRATEYLAVGQYRAASRQFALEIFGGPGFTNLIGFSVAALPAGVSFAVDRIGLQNAGARELDSSVGALTLSIDDLFTPATPPHQLSVRDASITEGDSGTTNLLVTVELAPAGSLPVSVEYATANGTATAGSDYIDQLGTLTFPPGIAVQTIVVPIIGDRAREATESFSVNLSNPSGAGLAKSSAVCTIFDNDSVPSLSINDASTLEGDSGATDMEFLVTLSTSSGQTVTVDFATLDQSAVAGLDYTATAGTLTFLPGQTSQRVVVPVLGDEEAELDESFRVVLSQPANADLGRSGATGTILDDDGPRRLSIDDVTVEEGNSGLTPAVFTVSLTRPSKVPISVQYALTGGSAIVGEDLLAASGQLNFPPGTSSTNLTVFVIGDLSPELDESFFIQLSNPESATIAKGSGRGLIRNDDPFPEVAIEDGAVLEGNTGTTTLVFPVRLSFGMDQAVTVHYATSDGSASSPGDYQPQSGTITFGPGSTVQSVSVSVQGDTLNEPDETFHVILSESSLATLGRARATGTIRNDDAPPVITVGDVSVLEGQSGSTNAFFTVSLASPSAQIVTVDYLTADETAQAGRDYFGRSGNVTFPPGETTQTIAVPVLGDTLFEPDETFILRLVNAVNGTIGRDQARATIRNDDPLPLLSVSDVEISEGSGEANAVFTLTLSKPSLEAAVTVAYATVDETASAGRDYVARAGTLRFEPGVTKTNLLVAILDDLLHEGDESFVLALSAPVNAELASPQARATIHDNDPLPVLFLRDGQVEEGDAGVVSLVFRVELDAPSGLPVTAHFTTRDGTATAASGDYVTASAELRFEPGVTNTTLTVMVNGDLVPEPDETLWVDLSQTVNAVEGRVHATGTIIDDDTRRLSVTDTTVTEGPPGSTTNALFTITLNKPALEPITVNYATSDGSATAGSDYLPASGTLTFAPGVLSHEVSVSVLGDDIFEPAETFFLNLSAPTHAELGRPRGTGTILNDDDALVIEPAGMTLLAEDCSPDNDAIDPGETVTVNFELVNRGTIPSATVVAQLLTTPGITPINAPQTYGTLLPGAAAVGRTFSFRADGECGQSLQAILQIQNGKTIYGQVAFSLALGTNRLGEVVCCRSADLAVTATVDPPAVIINQPLNYTVQVVNTGPGTATQVHMTNLWRGAVTVLSARSSRGTCSIQGQSVVGEWESLEPNNPVTLDLSIAPQETGSLIGIFNAKASEHDPRPGNNTATLATLVSAPLGLSINNTQIQEGDSGTTNAVFTVQLSPATPFEVKVDYATADGTALAGQDYTATQGTLIFPPGTTSATLSVPVLGDTWMEPDETFSVILQKPVNATLAAGHTNGTATILDNDFPALTVEDASALEPDPGRQSSAVFRFVLSEPSLRPVTVRYGTSDGTARASWDYLETSGQLTFPPGLTVTNVAVVVLADSIAEPEETFYLRLADPVATLLMQDHAIGRIRDRDGSAGSIVSITGVSVVEGGARTSTPAIFRLTLSQPSAQVVQVDYATANGTALGGSDYVITSGTVSFPPGETNAVLIVTVNGDDLPEPTERFFVRLQNPRNASLGVAEAEGTIINDDYLPRLVAAGSQLMLENCQPPNQAIDPLETVTVRFGIANVGLGPTTNLVALLKPRANLVPLSNPAIFGSLATNSPAAFRPFTFMIDGVCGQTYAAELELRDGDSVVGTLIYDLTLGISSNGQFVCCSSADLAASVVSSPEPVAVGGALTYAITITNQGPSIATGVLLTNRFSAPVQLLSASPGDQDCTESERQMVCQVGDLLPGQSLTVSNLVAPAQLGSLIDIVVVAARENDPVPTNNVAVVANTVIPATGLSINDLEVVEGDQDHPARFTVELWPERNQIVTVEYETADGTALSGQDYLGALGTVTFLPGVTRTNLDVIIKGNRVSEPDRTFSVRLGNPVNATLARAQAVGTIIDDDPPAMAIDDTFVNVGTNALVTAVLTVSLSFSPREEVTVEYETRNGTANAGTDYEAQAGTLVFAPGVRSLSIRIPISGNTADEGEEHFYVRLSNPQGAVLDRELGTVTITDEAPVDLSVSNASVVEGNDGRTNALFSVILRKRIQHEVTVEVFTSDGTARAGSDYVATNSKLVFKPGTLELPFAVPVLGDLIAEPTETFFLNLTNAQNGVIRSGRGVGTIIDDDPVPCLSIDDATVAEGNSGTNNAVFHLRLSGASSEPIAVEVFVPACASSPASGGNAVPQAVQFVPGQTESAVFVPVRGDLIDEPDETCLVLLTNALNATICRGQGLLTIRDDDPPPGLEISDVTVMEGDAGTTSAVFTVTRVGLTSQTITVRYATSDLTANSGSDYAAATGLLTFPPGLASTNITVWVYGDALVESDETFRVSLTEPVNATLLKAQGTGTIRNDDAAPQEECPDVVVLATPEGQTCFQPFAPILLTATPDKAADQVTRMEFYSGSNLLGIDTSSPFAIVWEGASVGDYCITARAICRSGLATSSEPTCIGVTDNGAAVAIIRNFDDPEIHHLRDYLLEMGYCARVFDQAEVSYDALSWFQLVIWDDLGKEGLTDSTVRTLGQLFDSGIPLYLIGERLVSTGNALPSDARSIWSNLLHLRSPARSEEAGWIAFSTSIQDRQPGAILGGRFAEVYDFVYTNRVDLTTATADATPLAFANAGDLLVQYPDVDAVDYGQARSVSQGFRVLTGGDPASVVARKALFQSAACWLMRCFYCGLVNIVLQHSNAPETVNVGDEFTFDLTVSNTGECISSGTIVTNHLPNGLGLVGVAYNQGTAADYDPEDRTLIWRVGSVVSGYENNAVLSVTVRALQPGVFQNHACSYAHNQRVTEFTCTTFDVRIEGEMPTDPPRLSLVRTALGAYQLTLTAEQAGMFQIQTSSDLRNWLNWTNAPGPVFSIELPEVTLPASRVRFYRAW